MLYNPLAVKWRICAGTAKEQVATGRGRFT